VLFGHRFDQEFEEGHALLIGYGAMLAESMVAIMALISASVIDPGVYFAMNSPAAVVGKDAASASKAVTALGFAVSPATIDGVATAVGEKTVISRAGGAPTLAVGMAQIFSQVLGGRALMAFWYHFAILFEALFILTAVDAGTRACRFMVQDLIGLAAPSFRNATGPVPALVGTGLSVAGWGLMLYQGVTDPLGGVNTLWPLFGISNQMLAAIALILATVVLFRMKQQRYAWVTLLPTAWLLICTISAGALKLFSSDPKVSFLAHAAKMQAAIAKGTVVAPAKSMAEMQAILFNDRIDAALTALFLLLVIAMALLGLRACLGALRLTRPSVHEIPGTLAQA